MANFADINVVERSADAVSLMWDVDASPSVASFKLYVSTDPTGTIQAYTAIGSLIPNAPSGNLFAPRRVCVPLKESVVKALGGNFANVDFTASPLFFRATAVNSAGAELGPVATAKTKALQSGYTAPSGRLGTQYGATLVSTDPYYGELIYVDRTITGGYVVEEVLYPAGATSGDRVRRVTYTAPFSNDGKATKVRVVDEVLP